MAEKIVKNQKKKRQEQEHYEETALAEKTIAILRLELLRNYKLAWLPNDVLAGLVIFAVTIPASLAYGQLAGLHGVNGLYASLVALTVYALFGTSRQLIVGAEAPMAILVAASLATVAAGGDATRFATLAMVEAILVGVILLLAGVIGIGFIADFIPKSVVLGFLNGVALIIILTQVGNISGIELTHVDFFPRLWELFSKRSEFHQITVLAGGACLLGLVLFHFIPKIPETLLMLVLATAAVIWWNLDQQGIKIVGQVPSGLPIPKLPQLSYVDVLNLLPIAGGIALVAFIDSTITGRAFAMKSGYQLDHNQELIALGLANVGAGLYQGFTVSSSHSRTAVNDIHGGRSQFAGLVAAGLLAVFLLHFTHILKSVPVVSLATIIIAAGIKLINLREVIRIVRTRPASSLVSVATTFAVLITGLITGILISVAFAIILVLHRLTRPHETFYRPRVPDSGLFVYRFAGPLFFFNAPFFEERVQQIVETAEPPINFLLINAEAIVDMDMNAVEMLERLHHFLTRRNIVLGICEAKGHFRKVLMNTQPKQKGVELYPNVASVVRMLRREQADKKEAKSSQEEIKSSKEKSGS